MLKMEFLDKLRSRLVGLPNEEVAERLDFYGEMIDDRIEEGFSEEEAVFAIGSVEEISEQIIADIPLAKIAMEKIKPRRRLRAWEIVLIVLGSPIWISLAAAAFAVIISIYAVIWSVAVSLWAVFASVAACGFAGITVGIAFSIVNDVLVNMAVVGAGIVCAGLAILMFFVCKSATKGSLRFTKGIALGIKKCFVRKEREE